MTTERKLADLLGEPEPAQHDCAEPMKEVKPKRIRARLAKALKLRHEATRSERDRLAADLALMTVAAKKLINSTEVRGQRFCLFPTSDAWADLDAAIAKAEGREND